MKTYKINEIFYSLQGEGFYSGKPAIFCRFSGCNLWSGIEKDRNKAICKICDTTFLKYKEFKDEKILAKKINSFWKNKSDNNKYVIFTGGEPLLQLDSKLIDEIHKYNFKIGIETNGTIKAPKNIDWICVSPKNTKNLKITKGNELKLLFPLKNCNPEKFINYKFKHFYLMPIDDKHKLKNTQKAIHYCLKHPQWNLSVQLHKFLNIL